MAADRRSDLFVAAQEVIANSRRRRAAVAWGAKLLGTAKSTTRAAPCPPCQLGPRAPPSRARPMGAVLYVRQLASMAMKLRRDLLPRVERGVDGFGRRCSASRGSGRVQTRGFIRWQKRLKR